MTSTQNISVSPFPPARRSRRPRCRLGLALRSTSSSRLEATHGLLRKVKVMKLLLIGASGTIGQAIATALSQRHELIGVSRHSAPAHVDISSPTSIRALFAEVEPIDGVISAAGAARRKPLAQMQDDD